MGWTIPLTLRGIPETATLNAADRWPQSVEAFEALVEAVQHELVHFAFCRLRRLEDAEDTVQDVLVRAYLEREKHRGVTGVRPYLFRMVANRCTDVLRRRQRTEWRRDHTDPADLAGRGSADPATTRLDEIEGLLTRLPERQAEAIRLRVFGRLPFAAIAEAVGVSLPTIKSRFRYGVERLRGILTESTVSEVRSRIRKPLADARGSDQSRDREGAVASEFVAAFRKRRTKEAEL
jgi:RNA polymerase sigma-70 factor (ECF subfamily)